MITLHHYNTDNHSFLSVNRVGLNEYDGDESFILGLFFQDQRRESFHSIINHSSCVI
jgi:hypothetical protein